VNEAERIAGEIIGLLTRHERAQVRRMPQVQRDDYLIDRFDSVYDRETLYVVMDYITIAIQEGEL